MGNCFGSVPFLNTMKDQNRMEPDSENRAGTSSDGSNGTRRKGRGSPKRPAERGEAGFTERRLKSASPGDTAEDQSVRSEMPPAEKKARKPNKRGKRGGKAAMNSVPTTSSASPPKKVKKEESADTKSRKEPARSPPPRNASPKKTQPVGKGDAKRGGGRGSGEAQPQAGTLDVDEPVRSPPSRNASPKEAWPIVEGVPWVAMGDAKRGGGRGSHEAKPQTGTLDVEEPARSPPPRNASPKEARPVAEGVSRVAKGDAKRGGGRGSREAMPQAGTLDVEEPARSPPPRNASPKEARPVAKGDAKRGGWRGSHEAMPQAGTLDVEEPARSPPPRNASPKEARPVAKGDAKRGGGRGSRETMPQAGTLDVEANMEVEYMEVPIQPETRAKTRQEPPVQGVSPPTEVKAETLPGRGDAVVVVVEEKKEKEEEEEEDDDDDGEEDIYRTEEEITLDEEKKKMKKKGQAHQQTLQDLAGPKDSSSVEAEVNLLSYSQKEWRGNTAKSALIRQGYEEVSQSYVGLRRVRGDNYCALRATLFQVFAQSAELPSWLREDDVTLWPEQLLAEKGQIGGAEWRFPTENQEKHAPEGAIEQLKNYMGRLRTRWEEVAQASGAQERQNVCESVFRAEDEEYGLLEVLKFLMLRTATELYERMQRGDEVPVFCWLLFARDTSSSPRAFLSNHLSHVGFSGGLEQVEMFLLGYALQQTIKVYRLYKAGTEEFVTNYPDDHKEWPCVCLVTEDDRHYNVPVSEAERLQVPESPTPD